ncbi:MAG: OmpA family protein [Bacteroidia bacterium]|nr:OmpA family protein [Bacteroidia bacterium]
MKTLAYLFLLTGFFLLTATAPAQILDVRRAVKNKVVNKVNNNIDQSIDKQLNKAEDSIKGSNNKKNAAEAGGKKAEGNASGAVKDKDAPNAGSTAVQTNQAALQAFSKYDFIPGEKVIFFDDFSQDAVGDFPALWTTNAPGEINTLNIAPGNWLNLNSGEGNYFYLNTIDFPKNFIVEFDIVPKTTGGRIAAALILYGETKPKEMDNSVHPGNSGIHISIEKGNWNTLGYKTGENDQLTGSSTVNPVEPEKVNHVIIWVQNRRLRIYHKAAKVLDMPTNIYDGTKFSRFCFRLSRGASCGSYLSNIRITDASPDMRSKLMTEGKLVTYGIYFDVNKDVVKPESYGTLKGIADVLKENPDVRVKIIGHTDSDGADAANLDLSKRRGASVKDELVKNFSIDPSRLESDGLGESQPVAPNDTPVNKSMNRRVEFIKL